LHNDRGLVEAAIVAAGFDFRLVGDANDCPECFSRPVTEFALRLCDAMPPDLQPEFLAPLVGRLAGSAGDAALEKARADFIAVEVCRRIVSEMCGDVLSDTALAEACRNARDKAEVKKLCEQVAARACEVPWEFSTYAVECAVYNGVAASVTGALSSAAASGNVVVECMECIHELLFQYFLQDKLPHNEDVITLDPEQAADDGYIKKYLAAAAQILEEAICLGNDPARL